MDSTYDQTTSGVACNHRLWAAHTVERLPAWHAIIAVGLAHTVRRRREWHAIIALGRQTRSNDVGRDMPSSPLGSTDVRTTTSVAFNHRLWTSSHSKTASGVACHNRPWTANTIEPRRAWHAIIAFGQHTRSNNVECGITSPLLDSTHGRTSSGVVCHHRLWVAHTVNDIGRGMPSY